MASNPLAHEKAHLPVAHVRQQQAGRVQLPPRFAWLAQLRCTIVGKQKLTKCVEDKSWRVKLDPWLTFMRFLSPHFGHFLASGNLHFGHFGALGPHFGLWDRKKCHF